MRIPFARRRRSVRLRQRLFPFIERSSRHERWFKRAILLATCIVIVLMLEVIPWARNVTDSIAASARLAGLEALGLSRAREAKEEFWRTYRQRGIEGTRPRAARYYAEASPSAQKLMRYAGMDPEHGLLRWGNFDWTMLLSSKVFEADDEGRSFRLRPLTHSIWLVNVKSTLESGIPTYFLVPDGPGLADAIQGTTARPLATSRQTTNSWGLRGPEPDREAPLRGLILGDSYMQGMFIGDDETPPECLRRYLHDRLKRRVSILNTGVMGYSPEQYYYSLIAFADRFQPQFVVVSVFANDFGDAFQLLSRGKADWPEGRYWLNKISDYCKAHHWPLLVVPAPFRPCLFGRRKSDYYPAPLTSILDLDSSRFRDPIEDFIDAHLQWEVEGKRKGENREGCALFNRTIDDDHFSAVGSKVWADSVGRRLLLILEKDGVISKPD